MTNSDPTKGPVLYSMRNSNVEAMALTEKSLQTIFEWSKIPKDSLRLYLDRNPTDSLMVVKDAWGFFSTFWIDRFVEAYEPVKFIDNKDVKTLPDDSVLISRGSLFNGGRE